MSVALWRHTIEHALFVSPSCSYASTTSGWQQTPREFWSWSQETLHLTSWSAPSSLSVWLMRFPSSPMTWPRWSSPKTAWPCWRDWGPWGSSLWLYCSWPGTASPHLALDEHLLMWGWGGHSRLTKPPVSLKWGTNPSQEQARCLSLLVATGDDLSCVEW